MASGPLASPAPSDVNKENDSCHVAQPSAGKSTGKPASCTPAPGSTALGSGGGGSRKRLSIASEADTSPTKRLRWEASPRPLPVNLEACSPQLSAGKPVQQQPQQHTGERTREGSCQRLANASPAPQPSPAACKEAKEAPKPGKTGQPDKQPGVEAGGAGAAGSKPAVLPDWCDRPLLLKKHYTGQTQAEGQRFGYLNGHPLLALACEGKAKLLQKVLQQGADPNSTDSRGFTALHLASHHNKLACVRVLLEEGATQLQDAQGRTPRQLAQAAGHGDVLAMMQEYDDKAKRQAEEPQQEQEEQQHAASQPAAEAGEAQSAPSSGAVPGKLS